jgi:GntR family transcriptional repressor for pyruvate dehydrogenase complex
MEPIYRVNISESIARRIIDLISKGVYAPGRKLPPEKELMQQLNVGRSSVREAFQALAIMGLVDIRPGLGTFVKDVTSEVAIPSSIFAPLISPDSAEDLLEARLLVEPSIAALAAKRHTKEDIDAIEDTLEKSRSAFMSGELVYPSAARFHVDIARASHNLVFIRFIETIARLFSVRGAIMEKSREYLEWEYGSHFAVFDAIRSRDPNAASQKMEEHVREVTGRYLSREGE